MVKISLLPQRFIIVRNLENLAASRIKKGWPMNRTILDTWEYYIKSTYTKIHYDRWLVDRSYRDRIADKMDVVNKDIVNTMSTAGGGSSFSSKTLPATENLLNRYQQITIPEETKKLLREYGQRNPEYCNVNNI
jgi:hypothetical protein